MSLAADATGILPATWMQVFALVMAIIGSLGGFGALFLVTRQRRKLSAETTQILTSAAVALVKPMEDRLARTERDHRAVDVRMKRAESEVNRLRTEVSDVRAENRRLRGQLRRLVVAITSPAATLPALRDLVATDITGQGS